MIDINILATNVIKFKPSILIIKYIFNILESITVIYHFIYQGSPNDLDKCYLTFLFPFLHLDKYKHITF